MTRARSAGGQRVNIQFSRRRTLVGLSEKASSRSGGAQGTASRATRTFHVDLIAATGNGEASFQKAIRIDAHVSGTIGTMTVRGPFAHFNHLTMLPGAVNGLTVIISLVHDNCFEFAKIRSCLLFPSNFAQVRHINQKARADSMERGEAERECKHWRVTPCYGLRS